MQCSQDCTVRLSVLFLESRHRGAGFILARHRGCLVVTHLPFGDGDTFLAQHSRQCRVRNIQFASKGPSTLTRPDTADELRDFDAAESLGQLVASVHIWCAQTIVSITKNREIPQFHKVDWQLQRV